MRHYVDPDTRASDPGNIKISDKKLKKLRPDFYGIRGLLYSQRMQKETLADFIMNGDSQPAVVMSLKPLLVAAYSDEMDAVAMLNLPNHLVSEYNLKIGDYLLSVNVYKRDGPKDADLMIGPRYLGNWFGFYPTIVDFISDDAETIREHKKDIESEHWEYVERLGRLYLELKPGISRNGLPGYY